MRLRTLRALAIDRPVRTGANLFRVTRQDARREAANGSNKTFGINGRHKGKEKEPPPHKTLIRRSDEPKLEIGDLVSIREGVIGVVLARFNPSGEKCNEVHYIVELRPETGKRVP